MRNEDGLNSFFRDVGRLALASIVASLGVGASIWLGVYITVHDFNHQLTWEQRAATYVDASPAFDQEKVKIEVKKVDCTRVILADFYSGTLLLHARNDCRQTLDYVEWHWQEISPNGIVISQGYHNSGTCPTPENHGQVAECSFPIQHDERISTLVIWTTANNR